MNYKVQETFKWFSQFEKEDIRIEGETKVFDIEMKKSGLPHLLGLQYIYRNFRERKGMEVYKYIQKENLSDEKILEQIRINNPGKLLSVKNRIGTLQEFLENIEKGYIVEQTKEKTSLKSNYLVVQSKGENFLQLAINSTEIGDSIENFEVIPRKDSYLETYIVQNNMKYFEKSDILEEIKMIYKYNELSEEFEPFTFSGKEIHKKKDIRKEYSGNEKMEKEENKKEVRMEYNKLYVYEKKKMVAIEELNEKGYKNIFRKYKERHEKKELLEHPVFEMFGINDKGELHIHSIDGIMGGYKEDHAYEYFQNISKIQGESNKNFLNRMVRVLDVRYDIGVKDLFYRQLEAPYIGVKDLLETEKTEMIETEEPKENKKEAKKIMEEIMREAKEPKIAKYKEERETFVDSVIKSLEEERIPWERNWESTSSIHHNPVSNTKYQGKNGFKLAVISFMKGYQDPRWVTFKQAQQAEWRVKKGEKATTIEVYKQYDKLTKKDFTEKNIQGMSSIEAKQYIQENVYGFIKTYNVFNGQQLEGIAPFKEEKREVNYNKVDKILENSKVPIQHLGEKAFYHPRTDNITLPGKENFKNENTYYGTVLHELSHSTGHPERLNREMNGKFGSKEYTREELVAEFSSVFIGQQLGLNYEKKDLENSKAYLQRWAKQLKEDKNLLYDAIKDAEIASKSIVQMKEKTGPEIFKTIQQKKEIYLGKNKEEKKGIER